SPALPASVGRGGGPSRKGASPCEIWAGPFVGGPGPSSGGSFPGALGPCLAWSLRAPPGLAGLSFTRGFCQRGNERSRVLGLEDFNCERAHILVPSVHPS